jgi:hypothetical protein
MGFYTGDMYQTLQVAGIIFILAAGAIYFLIKWYRNKE